MVFLLFIFLLQFQSLALSSRETILQLLKDYSPTGYYIVNFYLLQAELEKEEYQPILAELRTAS
jgi:hypothetical protein